MECVLQGVIEPKHVHALEQLVLGMTGALPRPLYTHEHIFQNVPSIGPGLCELRVSCPLDCDPDTPWTVVHEGGAMRGLEVDKLPALVRTVARAEASPSVRQLVTALGMRLEHDYLRKGTTLTFRHRGAILTLNVVSIFPPATEAEESRDDVLRIGDPSAPICFVPRPGLCLVDLSAPASSDAYKDVSAALVSFAEMLSPLLRLSRPGQPCGVPPTAAAAAAAIAPAC